MSDGDGTGIVHIAPAFGADDFWAAKNINPYFPVLLNVDDYGNFDETVIDFAGENIFAATPRIIDWLKSNGKLVKKETLDAGTEFVTAIMVQKKDAAQGGAPEGNSPFGMKRPERRQRSAGGASPAGGAAGGGRPSGPPM